MAEFLPEAGAVHGRRLIVAQVDGLQAGQDAERHEGHRDEDPDAALPDEVDHVIRAPVDRLADDTGVQQGVVQGAVFDIDDVFPHGGLDDQRRGPGEHDDGAGDLPPAEIRVQDQGDDKAQQGRDADDGNDPDCRVDHDAAELRRGDRGDVVLQAVESADYAGTGDLAEGQLEHDHDGINKKNAHQDQAGQKPQVRLPFMARETLVQGGPPLPPGRGRRPQ